MWETAVGSIFAAMIVAMLCKEGRHGHLLQSMTITMPNQPAAVTQPKIKFGPQPDGVGLVRDDRSHVLAQFSSSRGSRLAARASLAQAAACNTV